MFIFKTNALYIGLDVVLSQVEHLIANILKSLTKAERNYKNTERKVLTVL